MPAPFLLLVGGGGDVVVGLWQVVIGFITVGVCALNGNGNTVNFVPTNIVSMFGRTRLFFTAVPV